MPAWNTWATSGGIGAGSMHAAAPLHRTTSLAQLACVQWWGFECTIVGRLYNEDACVEHLSCAQPSAPAAAPHWQTSRLFLSPATYPPKQSRCSDLNALLSTPLALALTRRLLHCLTCRCHVFPHQHLPCIQCKRARVLQHFFENSTLHSTSRDVRDIATHKYIIIAAVAVYVHAPAAQRTPARSSPENRPTSRHQPPAAC